MAFVVSGLDNYKDQSSLDLLTAKTLGTKTASMCVPVPKVKSSFDLHLLANTPTNQVGGTCAFNASGSTTLTASNLVTSPIKWQMEFCLKALEAKYTQQMLKPGQKDENQTIPTAIMTNIIDVIAHNMEVNDWVGTIAGTAKYDGIHTLLETLSLTQANTSGYTPGGAALTAQPTTTTIGEVVYGLYNAMLANKPAVLEGNCTIVLPIEWFGLYQIFLLNKNYFAYDATKGTNPNRDTLPLLGFSGVNVMGTRGLSTEQTAYMFDFKNLHIGFDADGEEYIPEIWYSKDDRIWRFSAEARRGFQVAYPTEIMRFNIPAS